MLPLLLVTAVEICNGESTLLPALTREPLVDGGDEVVEESGRGLIW